MEVVVFWTQSMLTSAHLNVGVVLSTFIYCWGFSFSNRSLWALILAQLISMQHPSTLTSISFGLQNILSTTHPAMLLFCYSMCLVHNVIRQKNWSLLGLTLLTLMLTLVWGGWWAFQEFTWGGWWNWDSVEFPLLLLLGLKAVVYFHWKATRCTFGFVKLLVTLTLVTVIIVARYFSNSVHSFVSVSNFYANYCTVAFWANKFIFNVLGLSVLPQSFVFLKLTLVTLTRLLTGLCLWVSVRSKFHAITAVAAFQLFSTNVQYFEVVSVRFGQGCDLLNSNSTAVWVKPMTGLYTGNLKHIFTLIN